MHMPTTSSGAIPALFVDTGGEWIRDEEVSA
jgi:hypothetical protein